MFVGLKTSEFVSSLSTIVSSHFFNLINHLFCCLFTFFKVPGHDHTFRSYLKKHEPHKTVQDRQFFVVVMFQFFII